MSTTSYAAAWPSSLNRQASEHLLRPDGQEDLCFALWYPSRGSLKTTAVLHRLLLPQQGERRVHGNASFLPDYFARAIGAAIEEKAGLAFMHSHGAPGWQGMSDDDVRAEEGHAAATLAATGLPLVGLTLGTDGAWSARFWERIAPRHYVRRWCESVRVVGDGFSITFQDDLRRPPRPGQALARSVSAWGEQVQACLARLRVGVVGAGSVGAVVAETLARIGVGHIVLMDFDSVELLNLDRLLHADRLDAYLGEAKVAVLTKAIRRSGTASPFAVTPLEHSVVEEQGFRAALDCDFIFSCVDRPWPRSVMNFIAYAHLIPVADGGIRVEATPKQTLKRADWRAHVIAPGHRCLECLEQYDPALVSLEREGFLDDPSYIVGLPKDHPARRNENVFAFSVAAASMEVLQMIAMITRPSGVSDLGAQHFHFVPGCLDTTYAGCLEGCPYPGLIGTADSSSIVVTGGHDVAERARIRRSARRRPPLRYRLARLLQRVAHRLTDGASARLTPPPPEV